MLHFAGPACVWVSAFAYAGVDVDADDDVDCDHRPLPQLKRRRLPSSLTVLPAVCLPVRPSALPLSVVVAVLPVCECGDFTLNMPFPGSGGGSGNNNHHHRHSTESHTEKGRIFRNWIWVATAAAFGHIGYYVHSETLRGKYTFLTPSRASADPLTWKTN